MSNYFYKPFVLFNSNLDLKKSKPIGHLKLAKIKRDNIALHWPGGDESRWTIALAVWSCLVSVQYKLL